MLVVVAVAVAGAMGWWILQPLALPVSPFAFDVKPDGSLTNQKEFAKLEGGGNGDGSTFDTAGRLYVTTNPGVQVIGPDGKYLGIIPTPYGLISVAFAGADRKMLYVVARDNAQNKDWILGIATIAQGPQGRGK